jgi:hypothetical protein
MVKKNWNGWLSTKLDTRQTLGETPNYPNESEHTHTHIIERIGGGGFVCKVHLSILHAVEKA